MSDADCTASTNRSMLAASVVYVSRAVAERSPVTPCTYDECATDADCKAGMPATVARAACVPAGALGRTNAACVYGACRTNADCTKHPGGTCQYGLAAPFGRCVFDDVLFCAYPSDPCPAQACASLMKCYPNDDDQGRSCGQGAAHVS